MATAGSIIATALRRLGQIGAGEDPTDDENADCLEALNGLLDSWRNERLMCFAYREETLPLESGTASYSMGSTGDLTTERPVEIRAAYIVDGDQSYPVRLIDEAWYASIPDKTEAGDWPDVLLFRPSVAGGNATIIVHPVPNATRSLRLVTQVALTAFSATTDTVTLPPGWERAMVNNLAIEIAPEYEAQVPLSVAKAAQDSLAGIKRANRYAQPSVVATELGAMFGARATNITQG